MAKRRRKPGSIGLKLLRFGQERVETYIPGGSTLHRKPASFDDVESVKFYAPTISESDGDFGMEPIWDKGHFSSDVAPETEKTPDTTQISRPSAQSPIAEDQPVKPIRRQTSPAPPNSQNKSSSVTRPASVRDPSSPSAKPRKTPPDLLAILRAHEGKHDQQLSGGMPDELQQHQTTTMSPSPRDQINRTPKPPHPSQGRRPRRAQLQEITPHSRKKAEEAREAQDGAPDETIARQGGDQLPVLDELPFEDTESPFASFTSLESAGDESILDNAPAVDAPEAIRTSDDSNTLQRDPTAEEPANTPDELTRLSDDEEVWFDYDGDTVQLDADGVPEMPISRHSQGQPAPDVNTPRSPQGAEKVQRKPLTMPKKLRRQPEQSQWHASPPSPETPANNTNADDNDETTYALPTFDDRSNPADFEEDIMTEQMGIGDERVMLQPAQESPFTYFAGPKSLPQESTIKDHPRTLRRYAEKSHIQPDHDRGQVVDDSGSVSIVEDSPLVDNDTFTDHDDAIEGPFDLETFDDADDETALMTFKRPYPSGKIQRHQMEPTSPSVNTDSSVPHPDSAEADLLRLLDLPPDTPVAGLARNRQPQTERVQRHSDEVRDDEADDYAYPIQSVPLDVALLGGAGGVPADAQPVQRLRFGDEDMISRASSEQAMVNESMVNAPLDESVDEDMPIAGEAINVDKLARDVLNRLRHRLRIEQERSTKR